jgi:hypothetical protein
VQWNMHNDPASLRLQSQSDLTALSSLCERPVIQNAQDNDRLHRQMQQLLAQNPPKRQRADIDKALTALTERRTELARGIAEVDRCPSFRNSMYNDFRNESREYLAAADETFKLMQEALQSPANDKAQTTAINEQWERANKAYQAWFDTRARIKETL